MTTELSHELKCPKCGGPNVEEGWIIYDADHPGYQGKYRKCYDCEHKWYPE